MDYLQFAIDMELDGEKFYLEQAEKNKDNNLSPVFKFLAKDERKHAEIIKKKSKKIPYELTEDDALKEFENVFKDAKDFDSNIKTNPSQIDAYRLALKKEKESIDLYEKMHNEAIDKEGKELFKYLVKQEEKHYKIFDNIIQHLIKADEWVEDAEFGIRKPY